MEKEEVQALVSASVQAAVQAAVNNVMADFEKRTTPDHGAAAGSAVSVDVVAVKVTPFYTDTPEVWFVQLEDQFKIKGIKTESTKYEYVTSNLDHKVADEMQGFLLNPPTKNMYTKIKAELIRKYGKTQLQKDNELLGMTGLGDRTVSDLWSRVLALNKDPETFRRAWFLNLLPTSTRALLGKLATQGTMQELCEAADLILEQNKRNGSISAVAVQARSATADEAHPDLKVNPVQRGPARKTGQKGPHKPGLSTTGSFVCLPRSKFGTKAFSCREGCTFANLPLAARPAGAGNANAGR